MSKSYVCKVPDDLAEMVEAELTEFVRKNPTLAMGSDLRMKRLSHYRGNAMQHPALASLLATMPDTDPVDPQFVAALFNAARPLVNNGERAGFAAIHIVNMLRAWPVNPAEKSAYARRAKWSSMVNQLIREGLHARAVAGGAEMEAAPIPGPYSPEVYELGRPDWNPSATKDLRDPVILA